MGGVILWVVQYLMVDEERQTDLHRFVIRWTASDAGPTPVLYCDGKRVTKSWRLALSADAGEDEHGGNANTA